MAAVIVLAFGVSRCTDCTYLPTAGSRLTTRAMHREAASAAAGACCAGGATAGQASWPLPISLANVRPALSALRLSGGGGKKREAPSPKAPGTKRVAAGAGAADAADPTAAEGEEEAPDTSRNWDVQKVARVRRVPSSCLRIRLFVG
jgi:hypothetical protein